MRGMPGAPKTHRFGSNMTHHQGIQCNCSMTHHRDSIQLFLNYPNWNEQLKWIIPCSFQLFLNFNSYKPFQNANFFVMNMDFKVSNRRFSGMSVALRCCAECSPFHVAISSASLSSSLSRYRESMNLLDLWSVMDVFRSKTSFCEGIPSNRSVPSWDPGFCSSNQNWFPLGQWKIYQVDWTWYMWFRFES